MIFLSAYNLIDSVVVFLLLLLSLFLLRLSDGDRRSHRLLAAFLVCLALSYMDGVFMGFNYRFHHSYPYMVYATMSFDFLTGPLLYLYVRSRIQPDFRLQRRHLTLGLPFALHLSFLFANYYVMSLTEQRALLAGGQVFSRSQIYALTTFSNLHYAVYMVVILGLLRGYQGAIKERYSNLERVNLQWLFLICCGLLLAGAMRFMNNLLWLEVPQSVFHQYVDLKLVAIGSVLVFAATVAYKCLLQPEILRPTAPANEPTTDPAPELPPAAKYKTSALTQAARTQLAERLEAYMRAEKPYLNPDLSLAELARAVEVPSHHLSQVINGQLGQSFYDYVNGYRVRECAARLTMVGRERDYVTQIMYECGFNSKSVFNTVFKKTFGTTPSGYRKRQTNDRERFDAPLPEGGC